VPEPPAEITPPNPAGQAAISAAAPIGPPASLHGMFALEPHGPDTYVGLSPAYPWGRIYGGLVIAQGLWAATQTVPDGHGVHSLHAYFILGGDPGEPVRYEVDRIRNGSSFTTRAVVARQSGGAILILACSFQRFEEGVETQSFALPADAPDPATVPWTTEGSGSHRYDVPMAAENPRSLVWCRYPHDLGDDPRLWACGLAYLSDTNPMDAVAASHPDGIPPTEQWDEKYMSASLDHAVWFHRPARADGWLLFDMVGHGLIRTRGLATGNVFTADGTHVATIAQEGLLRKRR
jgi:acyl-CoA thioesterase II